MLELLLMKIPSFTFYKKIKLSDVEKHIKKMIFEISIIILKIAV